ncbi:MAG: SIS domain-containing protein [Pleomorphochaeta sp.]
MTKRNVFDVVSPSREIIEKLKDNGGLKNIFFIGCGGSLGAFVPVQKFVEKEAKTITSYLISSNEFCYSTPVSCGKNSIVICTSHKGETPETIKAAKIGKEKGAIIITFTYILESSLAKVGDYVLSYEFGDKKNIANEKVMQQLKFVVELINLTEKYEYYDAFYKGVAQINTIVRKAKEQVVLRAKEFGENHKDDKVMYTIGSGASWGSAYMENICILQEMQWIDSSSIHSGEFFHGPFEVIDGNSNIMLQIAEGETRFLDERVLEFLKKYAKRYEVLDAKELGLSIIDSNVIDYFNHSLFNNVFAVYNSILADLREHPLSTRRYMFKVNY